MTLDISADHALFDFSETVTLRQIRGDDGVAEVSVTSAINEPLNRQQSEAGGISIVGDERAWSLPVSSVGSRGIQVNDTFTDAAGDSWLVLSASLKTADTRWHCICRKEV